MIDEKTIKPADLAAAFDWWRDAGVDCEFVDDATDWLADSVAEKATAAPASPPAAQEVPEQQAPAKKIDLLGPEPPQDLAAFREWWLSAPGLDHVGPRGRVPPRGEVGAEVMILVTDPEEGDGERLLSQVQGRLLQRMLKAMGLSEDQVYVASAVPRHWPMADGASLLAAGYREVLLHHIALACPQRIISFGANILPLLAHNAAQDPKSLREINHGESKTPLMVSEGLDSMLAMPRLKARFWHKWLNWVEDGR